MVIDPRAAAGASQLGKPQMLRSPLPHAPACAHDAAAPSPHVPLACGPPKPRPPARLPPRPAAWLSARAGLSSERSAAACERAGCVWHCAGNIHRAIGWQGDVR
jgi:hypothetical protein